MNKDVEQWMFAQQVEQAMYQAQEERGRKWSESHPLPNGLRFDWEWGYDIRQTHYQVNPCFCSNCSHRFSVSCPRGQKRPDKIKNPYPCVNCGVVCDVLVGRQW